jgi:hypothetical protein
VCGIVLFRAVIVLFVAVEVVLVVDTCCTSTVYATPICTSPRSGLWAPNKWYQSTSSVVRCSTVVWRGSNLNKNMTNPIVPYVFGFEKFDGKQNFELWQGSVRDALVLHGLDDTLSSIKPTEMKDDK